MPANNDDNNASRDIFVRHEVEILPSTYEAYQRGLNRSCGACDRCCIDTAVAAPAEPHRNSPALHKPHNTKCKFLSKTRFDSRRCSIYNRRPTACVRYKCGWLQGMLADNMRPDRVGFMLSTYERRDRTSWTSWNDVSVTIFLGDTRRCGDLTNGPLANAIQELTARGINDIRILNQNNYSVIHFIDGDIRSGTLLEVDDDNIEDLNFVTFKKIGEYRVVQDPTSEDKSNAH